MITRTKSTITLPLFNMKSRIISEKEDIKIDPKITGKVKKFLSMLLQMKK